MHPRLELKCKFHDLFPCINTWMQHLKSIIHLRKSIIIWGQAFGEFPYWTTSWLRSLEENPTTRLPLVNCASPAQLLLAGWFEETGMHFKSFDSLVRCPISRKFGRSGGVPQVCPIHGILEGILTKVQIPSKNMAGWKIQQFLLLSTKKNGGKFPASYVSLPKDRLLKPKSFLLYGCFQK